MPNMLGRSKMKKIAIYTDNLKVGGIQKSVVNLLNNLDYEKVSVDLYLFDDSPFYKISDKVNVIIAKKPNSIFKFLPFEIVKKVLKVKSLDKKYDLAIDFDSYQMHTAIGALNCQAKVKAIWVHNDVEEKLKEEFKYKILHFFFKRKYNYFDSICAVSIGAMDSFKRVHKLGNKNYVVIPNYIDDKEIIAKSKEKSNLKIDKNKLNLVSVGRLCHQKGYDILLNTLAQVIKVRQDVNLYIVGDGPQKDSLLKQCKELGIDKYVTFLGNQKNPYNIVNKMDAFVLTSRYEGQGIVLLEAGILGVDVLIPKHLEKYCDFVHGTDNLVETIINYKKQPKKVIDIKEYNQNIIYKFMNLMNDKKE